MIVRILALLVLLLAPGGAWAQCVGAGGVPFNCSPSGGVPQATDIFLGGSVTGSPANKTVKYTGAQVIDMDHSASPVTALGTTQTLAQWLGTARPIGVPTATIGTLPAVTSLNAGQMAFVTDCQNGSQAPAAASGCLYVVDKNGVWAQQPSPYNLPTVIGGQALFIGGTSSNQGNGPLLQLSTGVVINGNCAQFDANGNIVDAGGPCGGGGGSGNVSSGAANSLAYYASSGTTVAGLTTANNGLLVTNGSGVPSITSTLPTGLTITSPTISGAAHTGTTTMSVMTGTGKWTSLASTTGGAGFSLPQGQAPTSPSNGDVWLTAGGLFARANTTTQGPFVASIVTTSPLAGGAVGPIVTLTCATCATTTSGGALSAVAPAAISSGGAISIGAIPFSSAFYYDSTAVVHNDTYTVVYWPNTSGTITGLKFFTGGTSTPSFQITAKINGVNVPGCTGISVSSPTIGTVTCTGTNTISLNQPLTLQISTVLGVPSSAFIQIVGTKSAS